MTSGADAMTVMMAESCIEQNHDMLVSMNVSRMHVKALEQQCTLLRKERDDWRTMFRKEASVRGHVLDVLDENQQLKVRVAVAARCGCGCGCLFVCAVGLVFMIALFPGRHAHFARRKC